MIRNLLRRGLFGLACFLGASIPIVDQVDLFTSAEWVDWIDGLWTIIASSLLVWLVRIAQRLEN